MVYFLARWPPCPPSGYVTYPFGTSFFIGIYRLSFSEASESPLSDHFCYIFFSDPHFDAYLSSVARVAFWPSAGTTPGHFRGPPRALQFLLEWPRVSQSSVLVFARALQSVPEHPRVPHRYCSGRCTTWGQGCGVFSLRR